MQTTENELFSGEWMLTSPNDKFCSQNLLPKSISSDNIQQIETSTIQSEFKCAEDIFTAGCQSF